MPKKATKSAKKTGRQPVGTKKANATKKKAATRKPAAASSRASTATPGRVMTRRTGGQTEIIGLIGSVTNEEIALKAYYLAERRRHLGLPGNPESDWLEAERLLRR
jgi:hypothetical protein